jgi:hypothetical protein
MTRIEAVESPLARAVNGVHSLSDQEVAEELVNRLGVKITALLESVSQTNNATECAKGADAPKRPEAPRAALQATRALATRYGNDAARGWFMSTNPGLGMTSPLMFLREARTLENLKLLVICAVQDVS